MREFDVTVGAEASRVQIGRGLLDGLGEKISEFTDQEERALIAVDEAILTTHGVRAQASLAGSFTTTAVAVEAREEAKVVAAVESLWDAMLQCGVSRGGVVVGMGGGITGDVVGFAAASWMRGVRLVLVPTTLLAMVDASIGGKTGINVPLPDGGLGKNLAGAFWPAELVVCDIETLETLDDREFRCGLAECVKHAVIDGPESFAQLSNDLELILARDLDAVEELVARSIAIKANIVGEDPREGGSRALLNLGHTFAHALESRRELGLLHGEAVAIGLMAACAAAKEIGFGEGELAEPIGDALKRAGLPVRLSCEVDLTTLRASMGLDKKASAGRVRLVLPKAIGSVEILESPGEEAIQAGLKAIACR